jgi:signal transduction histidine kinase
VQARHGGDQRADEEYEDDERDDAPPQAPGFVRGLRLGRLDLGGGVAHPRGTIAKASQAAARSLPAYPPGVATRDSAVEPEPWGEDPKLVELLGAQGAAEFRALLDGFPESVGILWAVRDAGGRIVDFSFGYGNPSILRAFRLPAATRDRYTLLEALPAMRGSHAFDEYINVCESGQPWMHEVTYDTPFGDGYMLGTFIQRTAKLGDGLVNFLSDVTEQRRMEAELRSYADVVAHDLNEPIAGIAMLVRLLERRADEPPSADVLRQLRTSTERARDLIDGVLLYARAGELSTERVALGELTATVIEDLRASLDTAGATLDVGELPEVEGDPRQLRRVVQNLLGNAVKFRGEVPLRIEVSALRDSQEWVVTMRDNGRGVDPDQATRIFGMFSRADHETDGAGIGLAVCRRIIEAHGGRIWVEAADGGGSAFRFTLPR